MRKKLRALLSGLALAVSSSILLSTAVVMAAEPGETATMDFVVKNTDVAELGSTANADLFQMGFTGLSKNGGLTDTYNFRFTLNIKTGSNRTLTDARMIFDYMYYSQNYWGGNGQGTPMIWSNEKNAWLLPNPWVTSGGDIDTSASLTGPDGVKVYFNDTSVGTAGVSDLSPILKGDITSVTTDSAANLAAANSGMGTNMTQASNVPLDARLTGVTYSPDALIPGTSIAKTMQVVQEKIAAFGDDSGRWYGFDFVPKIQYSYTFPAEISATAPLSLTAVQPGSDVNFHSDVTVTANYGTEVNYIWQKSTDNGATFEDMPGQTSPDLNFTATYGDNGNQYRLAIEPKGNVLGGKLYSAVATLEVLAPIGTVTAKYVNTENQEIAPAEVLSGSVDTAYSTEAKAISGYTLTVTPANANGLYTESAQEVVYIYEKVVTPTPTEAPKPTDTPEPSVLPATAGKVLVSFVDENNQQIADPVELKGEIGENYQATAKEIAGYKLKEKPKNLTGQFSQEEQKVTFVYSKTVLGATTPQLTKTGQTDSPFMLLGGLLLLAGMGTSILVITKKQRKASTKN